VLVGVVYAVQHDRAARRLADAVDAQLASVQLDLARARAAARVQRALAREAYAAFDALQGDAAEVIWSQAVASRGIAERTYRGAGRGIEAALAKDPTRGDVRALLGDVLLERAQLAERVHDADATDELLSRLPAYDDDGSRRARASTPGTLTIHAPREAAVAIDGTPAGTGDVHRALAPGPYLVEVTQPGRVAIREPIVIVRDETLALDLTPPAWRLPAGFIYIAPGWFQYGSASDEGTRRTFLATVPLHFRLLPGFLVARTEITFGDWLAYVEAQPEAARAKLLPDQPLKLGGGIKLEHTDAGWQLALRPLERMYMARWNEPLRYEGRDHNVAHDWRKLPVLGLSAADAEGYAAWLARSGRLPGARLCDELEWERGARGPDGRTTPTGRVLDGDDADIDRTYRRDLMGPDEVGLHPASASPYGLQDTAGNAFEWVRGERPETYVARGGSYYHDRKTADLTNRNETAGTVRDPTAGARLCVTLP
jgi:formylglycine-generating enzyme required for sulfatase activity